MSKENNNTLKIRAMNIKKDTLEKIKSLGYHVWGMGNSIYTTEEGLSWTKADHLVVVSEDFKINTFKAPKNKEVTVEWVMDKLNSQSAYLNLSKYLRKIFDYSISIYPTSYGIGVDAFCGKYKDSADKVASKLSELGLKYRNEFSDARWVYRFVVSRNAHNINILKSL